MRGAVGSALTVKAVAATGGLVALATAGVVVLLSAGIGVIGDPAQRPGAVGAAPRHPGPGVVTAPPSAPESPGGVAEPPAVPGPPIDRGAGPGGAALPPPLPPLVPSLEPTLPGLPEPVTPPGAGPIRPAPNDWQRPDRGKATLGGLRTPQGLALARGRVGAAGNPRGDGGVPVAAGLRARGGTPGPARSEAATAAGRGRTGNDRSGHDTAAPGPSRAGHPGKAKPAKATPVGARGKGAVRPHDRREDREPWRAHRGRSR